MKPLDVAVAVIEREGRYLIAQRKPGDSFGGWWEFPGGKALPGEPLETCLAREIQEELGVSIEVGQRLQVIDHHYPGRTLRLHCYLCHILSGEPQAIDCEAWQWVGPEQLSQFQFPPASAPIIQKLLQSKGAGLL